MEIEEVLHEGEEALGSVPVKRGTARHGISRLLAVTPNRVLRIDGESYVSIPHSSVDFVEFERNASEPKYESESAFLGLLGGVTLFGGGLSLGADLMGGVAGLVLLVGVVLVAGAMHLHGIKTPYYETLTIRTSERTFRFSADERDSLNKTCALITKDR